MGNIYLFGDQTIQVDDALHKLLHVKDNPILKSFLDEAFAAVRKQIFLLPANERASLPDAHTFPLLLDAVRAGQRHVALESALVCLCEIGQYIGLVASCISIPPYSSMHRLLQTTDLSYASTGSILVGLCTGSLAAAAVSCAQTSIDLLTLGIEAVVVAFRVGMHAARRAKTLVGEGALQWKPWSVAVAGLSEPNAEKMLETFMRDQVSGRHSINTHDADTLS